MDLGSAWAYRRSGEPRKYGVLLSVRPGGDTVRAGPRGAIPVLSRAPGAAEQLTLGLALDSMRLSARTSTMSNHSRVYESYEGFLREAIKRYWETGRGKKLNFLSLLFASSQAWMAAVDNAKDPALGKKVLTGAAGAAAVGVLLRVVLGGPIGLLLTAASIASLVAIYVKNHQNVVKRAGAYREIIAEYDNRYNDLSADSASTQHALMIDGLMVRFLDDLDNYELPETPSRKSAFADHVDQQKQDTGA